MFGSQGRRFWAKITVKIEEGFSRRLGTKESCLGREQELPMVGRLQRNPMSEFEAPDGNSFVASSTTATILDTSPRYLNDTANKGTQSLFLWTVSLQPTPEAAPPGP